MAGGVTTRGLMVVALVAILVSIPASPEVLQRLRRSLSAAQKVKSTTIRTQSSTSGQMPSSTTIQTPSTTTIRTPNISIAQVPSTTTLSGSVHVVRGSSQQEWTPKTFPNPQLQPMLCSRGTSRSWVCDPNAVLSKKQADTIDNILTEQSLRGRCQCGEHCAKSPSHKGIQGAVALVNKMYFLSTKPTSKEVRKQAEYFGEYLRDKAWEFELCNDDYVIFISVKDRQVFTATGENARSVMTDTCVRRVLEEARPKLSKGDFGNALELMVRKYTDVLRIKHPCNRPHSKTGPLSIGAIIGLIVAVIGLICCCGLCCYCANKHRSDADSNPAPAEEHHLHEPQPDHYYNRSDSFDRQESQRRGSDDSGGAGGGF